MQPKIKRRLFAVVFAGALFGPTAFFLTLVAVALVRCLEV